MLFKIRKVARVGIGKEGMVGGTAPSWNDLYSLGDLKRPECRK